MAELNTVTYNIGNFLNTTWYNCMRSNTFFVKHNPFQFQYLQTDTDVRIWLCMETWMWRREYIILPPFSYSFKLIGRDDTVKEIGGKSEGTLLPGQTQIHLPGQIYSNRKVPDVTFSKQDLTPNFLHNGELKIRCDFDFSNSKDQAANPFEEIEKEVHRFCDFTLECEDQEIPVNRLLLAARSPVFSAMLSENFLEAKTGRAVIKDVDPKSLEALVKFCHTDNLDKDDLTTDLLMAANKYLIPKVVKLCEEHLSKTMSVDNAIDYFLVACLVESDKLRTAAKQFITENLGKVEKTEDFKNLGKEALVEVLQYSCKKNN